MVHREASNASPAVLQQILRGIEAAVSAHVATTTPYLREVIKVYAGLQLRLPHNVGREKMVGRHELGDTFYVGLASPVLVGPALLHILEEMAHAPAPRQDAVRLIVYGFVVSAFDAMPRGPCIIDPACGVSRARSTIRHMIERYAPECTFKTRGDLNVHSELMINHLPSWVTSAMVENEMPYPLVAKVLEGRGNVNKVVRPLLDCAITDSVAAIDFDADTFHVSHYITMVCLILELLATDRVGLLVNAGVLKSPETVHPMPYLWRDTDGVLQHGVRHAGRLLVFAPDVPATDACLQWLLLCSRERVVCTKHLTDLVFTPDLAEDRNPFRKFLF